jgi:hypothetical protein
LEYWIPVLAAIGAAIAAFWRTKSRVDTDYIERLEKRLEATETSLERSREEEDELLLANKVLERQNAELRNIAMENYQKISELERQLKAK